MCGGGVKKHGGEEALSAGMSRLHANLCEGRKEKRETHWQLACRSTIGLPCEASPSWWSGLSDANCQIMNPLNGRTCSSNGSLPLGQRGWELLPPGRLQRHHHFGTQCDVQKRKSQRHFSIDGCVEWMKMEEEMMGWG